LALSYRNPPTARVDAELSTLTGNIAVDAQPIGKLALLDRVASS
jgi:hypothetical protein